MDKENFDVEHRIYNFARAFIGLVKCCNVNMGIDLKEKQLVVQDKETLKIGRISLEKINHLIESDKERNEIVKMSTAREIMRVSHNTIPHLTNSEADTIMIMLHGTLNRMMKERIDDDIYDISK